MKRITVSDMDAACNILDEALVSYDFDSANRILVDDADFEEIETLFDTECIVYQIM